MKKQHAVKIIMIVGILLFLGGFIFIYETGSPTASLVDNPDPKTERLFRQMGVLRQPYLLGTVEFDLKDFNGQPARLSDFKGRIVFLNFWATWCPDCLVEMPAMQNLHTRLKGRNFVMITINIKEPASVVKKFFNKHGLTFSGLLDLSGRVSSQMGIRAIPTTYILDNNGKILGMVMGSRKWDSGKSVALFEHLINKYSKDSL